MAQYPELEVMRKDMAAQRPIYRPTAFWENASQLIEEELTQQGIEGFRSLPLPLGFFVPTYGTPANGFSAEQVVGLNDYMQKIWPEGRKPAMALEQFLEGKLQATAEYRVLLASDSVKRHPYLHYFSESEVGNPVGQFEFGNRRFSRSSLNYLLGLAFLKQSIPELEIKTVLEIGGGFGTLGEILSTAGIPNLRYIDIDIPPVAFVAQYYLSEVIGASKLATYASTKDQETIEIESLPQASVLCSWQIERLVGQVDLFVNFISFQEMEPDVVQNYLSHVRRLDARYVLLRNILEGKQVRKAGASLGVDVPVKGDDYAVMLPDYELIARNVFPFGYQTVDGFHSELQVYRRKKP